MLLNLNLWTGPGYKANFLRRHDVWYIYVLACLTIPLFTIVWFLIEVVLQFLEVDD